MNVVSVNIGEPKEIIWKGKKYTTGIYKQPVSTFIVLGTTDVEEDHVVDRKYHGGVDKACYAFSSDEYNYWKELYPDLELNWGSFGENLSISELNETEIRIGDVFQAGTAIIQASEPRQPCVKLNMRFQSDSMMKQFISRQRCGVYFRVLEPGVIRPNDTVHLIQRNADYPSVTDCFNLLYGIGTKEEAKKMASVHELGEAVKNDLIRIWKIN